MQGLSSQKKKKKKEKKKKRKEKEFQVLQKCSLKLGLLGTKKATTLNCKN